MNKQQLRQKQHKAAEGAGEEDDDIVDADFEEVIDEEK